MKHSLVKSHTPTKYLRKSPSLSRDVQWRIFTIILILSDLLMLSIAFRLAYFIRFEMSLPIFNLDGYSSVGFYQKVIMILMPLWLLVFAVEGLYDRKKLLTGMQEYSMLFNSTMFGMFLIIAASFTEPNFRLARGWLFMSWAFVFLFTSLGRFIIRRVVFQLRKHGYFVSNAVIVGANNEGLSLANQFLQQRHAGLRVRGFIDKKVAVGKTVFQNLKVLGNLEQIDQVIQAYEVDELILASSAISTRDKLLEIFQRYGLDDSINVRLSSGLYETLTTGLVVQEIAYVPMVSVNPVRLTGVESFLKALLDYCVIIPAMVLLSPLFLLLVVAIKLDSPGPAIYRRRVMGVNGEEFDAFKFRTMYVNGDEILAQYPELQKELAENHKLKNDPRITRVGRFLRKTSLDELPQLFNVLRGEMSLVGPRIISPEEIDKYHKWNMNLLTVKPGLSGLWQVSGRSDLSYQERVNLDMYYIRNWSIWLDLQILFQTIPVVIKGTGAY